ncbi:uncharacterized protein LOC142574151 [Dermacentor variabilis]|uniref:uncharacterized protein LOC142574151 n=1 Tax=Dermacentor variabilis TaxID=34621 RepID=UPI003F5B621D
MLAEETHASANLDALRAALSRFRASFFSSKTCSYMNLCQFYMMNYDRKRRVARRRCPCEVGDYSRTCPTVGRVGAREAMTVIGKQYRASSCHHRRSRGRKRKATLDKMSSLDEGRNYSPSTTPAPHRQPVKSIVLKQEHSPCRRFEDAAKPRAYSVRDRFLRGQSLSLLFPNQPMHICSQPCVKKEAPSPPSRAQPMKICSQPCVKKEVHSPPSSAQPSNISSQPCVKTEAPSPLDNEQPTNICSQPCIKKEAPSPSSSAQTSRLAWQLRLPREMLSLPSAGVVLEGCKEDITARPLRPHFPHLFTFGAFTHDILLY